MKWICSFKCAKAKDSTSPCCVNIIRHCCAVGVNQAKNPETLAHGIKFKAKTNTQQSVTARERRGRETIYLCVCITTLGHKITTQYLLTHHFTYLAIGCSPYAINVCITCLKHWVNRVASSGSLLQLVSSIWICSVCLHCRYVGNEWPFTYIIYIKFTPLYYRKHTLKLLSFQFFLFLPCLGCLNVLFVRAVLVYSHRCSVTAVLIVSLGNSLTIFSFF